MKIIAGNIQGYKVNSSMTFMSGKIDYSTPFYVEDISGSPNSFGVIKHNDSAPTLTIEKSLDKVNWEVMGTTSTTEITASIPANGRLYIRCKTNNWSNGVEWSTNKIQLSGRCNIGGNIMSLLYGDDFTGNETSFPSVSEQYIFDHLFHGQNNIISVYGLQFPVLTLGYYVYNSMFYGCRSLLIAPKILPATNLGSRCYQQMFMLCTSLIKTPDLIAATSMGDNPYYRMFRGCRSLNEVRCLTASINNEAREWLYDVSSTGTFYKKIGATWPTGSDGIPEGWTVVEV